MVTIVSKNYLCTAANLLCVVKLEGRELQLQIQATLCSEKHDMIRTYQREHNTQTMHHSRAIESRLNSEPGS